MGVKKTGASQSSQSHAYGIKRSSLFNLFRKYYEHILFFSSLLVLAIIIIILRSNFLEIPLERDEGDYALAGKLILEGARPYVDVFEQKPPGLFYSYALVSLFFGTSVAGIKMGFILINILTVTLISLGIRNLLNPAAGFIGGFTFAILSLNPYASGYAIQAEHLLIFFVSLSFFFLSHYYKKQQLYALIVSGAAVAWSAAIKQNGLYFIIAFTLGVLAIHLARDKFDLKKLTKEVIYLAIGGLGMATVVMLIMLLQGIWDEFIFWSITFPREFYISKIPFDRGMSLMQSAYNRISEFDPWLWYGSAAGVILIFATRLKWALKVWILLIVTLAFFSIWPGLRFYGHYWLQLFFGLALGSAALAYVIYDLLTRFVPKPLAFALPILAFLIFAISGFIKNKSYYITPSGEGLMNGIYGDNPFMEARKIAEFINSKKPDKDNDKLVVLGSEPQILLETGLQSPTPHTFLAFVASSHPASSVWRKEYMEMLVKDEAKYAVFVAHPFSWLVNGQEAQEFVSKTYMHIVQNYKPIGVADIISTQQTIYKWNEEATNYRPQSEKFVLLLERR